MSGSIKYTLDVVRRCSVVVAAALASAACVNEAYIGPGDSPRAAEVTLVKLDHVIEFPSESPVLMPTEQQRMMQFLRQIKFDYADRIILAPVAEDGPNADLKLAAISGVLSRQLVSAYQAPMREVGPDQPMGAVLMTVERHVVTLPDCPDWHNEPTTDWKNSFGANFGCADASNLAMMVSEPSDLLYGRDPGLAMGERAARAIARYRKGQEKPPGGGD